MEYKTPANLFANNFAANKKVNHYENTKEFTADCGTNYCRILQ